MRRFFITHEKRGLGMVRARGRRGRVARPSPLLSIRLLAVLLSWTATLTAQPAPAEPGAPPPVETPSPPLEAQPEPGAAAPEPIAPEAAPDSSGPPDAGAAAGVPAASTDAEQPAEEAAPAPATLALLRLFVRADPVGPPVGGIGVRSDDGNSATTLEDGSAEIQLGPGPRALELTLPLPLTPAHPGPAPKVIRLEGIDLGTVKRAELRVAIGPDGTPAALELVALPPEGAAAPPDAALAPDPAAPERGQIVGTVVSRAEGVSREGVSVFIEGIEAETTSDASGRFVLDVPVGRHTLWVIHKDFPTLTLNDVTVHPGKQTPITIRLEPASSKTDDWVIVAPHIEGGVAALMVERRASSNVTDVIGAEEMTRAGASDAAGALRRVTGINVVGGKFIYVRGMGERYSATLLNGQTIPSPDPERRVVPLDLFPIQVLESVVIQKTFSPDMPAEFGGGTVLLRTRSYPKSFTFQLGVSAGMNTQTTFRDGPTYEGGDLDFLGTDDGTRALPAPVRAAGALREQTRFEPGQTPEQLQALGRAMPNLWNVYRTQTPPDSRLTLTIGDRYNLGSVPVGFLASGLFSTAYNRVVADNRRFVSTDAAEGGLQLTDEFRIESLEQTTTAGGIFALGSEFLPGHEIRSTTLLLRVTDDRVDLVTGFNDNVGRQVRGARLRFIERQLLTEQVMGHHTFDALRSATLDWNYAFATATLDDPDRREYFYYGSFDRNAAAGPFTLGEEPERLYTVLDDRVHDLKLAYTQPFGIWSGLEAKAKVGASLISRDRESDLRRYRIFTRGTRISDAVNQQAPEDILAPENFAPDGLELGNVTDESDTYTADQRLEAAYAMAELPLVRQLELMGGARVERSTQNVITTSRFNPGAAERASLENTDVLPASTLTWRFIEDMALRGGYGRTVSRPEFRELANVPFYDVTINTAFSGNPELERATIDSYDLRWEWYLSPVELVSLGGFYKAFARPIELVAEGGAGDAFTWQNAESATNWGVELEGRRSLGLLADALKDLFVAFNVAYINSDVDLRGTSGLQTSRQRPLQGQAPYVINAQFGFDDSATGGGTTATLLYNVTGRWIAQVGVSGAPDIYQEPVHQLDFSASQRLPAGFNLTLRANNLLNPYETRRQGNEVVREFQSGRSVSLGVSWAP